MKLFTASLVALVVFLVPNVLFAQENEGGEKDAAYLNLRYSHNFSHSKFLDRDNIAELAMAPISLVNEVVSEEFGDSSLTIKLSLAVAAVIIEGPILKVAHEYGHFSAHSKGEFYDYAFEKDPISFRKRSLSYIVPRVYADSLGLGLVDDYYANNDWDKISAELKGRPDAYQRFWAAQYASGLNEEEVIRTRLAKRITDGQFFSLDTVPYFLTALSTITYNENDLDEYVSALEKRGISTSENQIRAISALRLLSGSSIVAAKIGYGWLSGNSVATDISSVDMKTSVGTFKMYWPEVETYLSEEGPTVKVVVPIIPEFSGMEMRVSYEQALQATKEGGLEIRQKLTSFLTASVASFKNSDDGTWCEGGMAVRPIKWLELGLTAYRADGYTLHRDLYGATYSFNKDRESGVKATVGLSLAF